MIRRRRVPSSARHISAHLRSSTAPILRAAFAKSRGSPFARKTTDMRKPARLLKLRYVYAGSRACLRQPLVFHASHHTDDCRPARRLSQLQHNFQLMADWVDLREPLTCAAFVNEHHALRILVVPRCEITSAQKRYPRRLQKSGVIAIICACLEFCTFSMTGSPSSRTALLPTCPPRAISSSHRRPRRRESRPASASAL